MKSVIDAVYLSGCTRRQSARPWDRIRHSERRGAASRSHDWQRPSPDQADCSLELIVDQLWSAMLPSSMILPAFCWYRFTVAWATSPLGWNFTVVVMPWKSRALTAVSTD